MPRAIHIRLLNCAFLLAIFMSSLPCLHADETFTVPGSVATMLQKHCLDCHGGESPEGDVRLDLLAKLGKDERLALLNRVQEQVFTNQMPPEEKLPPGESDAMLTWASAELARYNASKLEDKLRHYKYANYISHEKLFSGEIKDMPFTPARRWRINELIYNELVFNLFRLRETAQNKRKAPSPPQGLVQPFNLPSESGVKYYDTEVVEGGQFLTLLDNAKYIVGKQLIAAVEKTDNYVAPPPPPRTGDHFKPKRTEPEFEKLILSQEIPADDDLEAAITCQFQLALQRPPTTEEKTQYLQFMKAGIKSSSVADALEKMMISVLLEPDFLYRREFGDGQRDSHGRMKLTPREASYALSYALTDRVPGAALVEAANSGKLSSKEDYRREVLRMLNDDSLDKPRIIRFFQDYFGYYNVYNIFKDEKRFAGEYNPHRASSRLFRWRVPKKVTEEADTLVRWILKEDQDVFKQLLTTDKFFVHHNGDNSHMAKLAEEAAAADHKYRVAVEKLQGLSGSKLKAAQENLDLGLDRKFQRNVVAAHNPALPDRKPLPHFDESLPHAVKMYNLDSRTWSYEAFQPFKVDRRMGMLMHPAWLVSFAKNTETDPILRGKWIREKLLSGIVPDVPISVEAQVPEAHDQTLRQRITSVTEKQYCWSCHQKMNPLGNPFESFDDFGRFRTEEMLEHPENIVKTVKEPWAGNPGDLKDVNYYKTLPVDTSGALAGTGDKSLDGDVADAFDLVNRLAKSDRVRQSFIRNVFRYFMGRNEMLSDSKTLIEADKAYLESGGSFKALMVSLLTSDSFIYRK